MYVIRVCVIITSCKRCGHRGISPASIVDDDDDDESSQNLTESWHRERKKPLDGNPDHLIYG